MRNKLVNELIFEENNFGSFQVENIRKFESDNKTTCDNSEDFNYRYSNNNLYFKGEIALWKAVILQALVDLQSNSKKKIANTYRVKALMWFNLKNEEFITVCNYAGLDPKYVYEKAQNIKNQSKFLM